MGGSDGTSSVSSRSAVASGAEAGDSNMERGAWGGKVEFILTCIGYAVGLGNVWRFPYLTYKNGGGAFLIPFVIMLVIIGIPLFFMELCWGQFASLGPIAIWNMNPLLKGLGFSMVITNLMIAMYYNVIISWCIYYLFASMTDKLPWETCDNLWNTMYCMETKNFRNISENYTLENNETVPRMSLKSPSEEYYYRKVLQMSDDVGNTGTIVWELALCLFLCWGIVFGVLIKGIGSLGKVVYFTSLFPYVLLTIMLIRGVTLEGAGLGITFYLTPDWGKLASAQVWSDAATQIFYALSTCTGGLLAMASYNQFNNNTLRDSLIVPIVNVLTSFYAGFVIFSVLGYMAEMKGVEVADVAAGGPGLVFVVYPEGLTTMPVAPLWSILFFFMMLLLGFSSMFSMAECFFSGFMDEYPSVLRKTYYRTVAFRAVGCLFFYLISLPMVTNAGFYVFTLYDSYTGGFPLLIIGVVEILSISYIYGYKNFADDIKMMLGKKPNIIFRICWMAVSPVVLLAIIIFTAVQYQAPVVLTTYVFPLWAEGIGWLIVGLCLFFIPVVFLYGYCRDGGLKLLYVTTRPTDEWGPAKASDRTGRYARDTKPFLDNSMGRHDDDDDKKSKRSASLSSGAGIYENQPEVLLTVSKGFGGGLDNVAFVSDHHHMDERKSVDVEVKVKYENASQGRASDSSSSSSGSKIKDIGLNVLTRDGDNDSHVDVESF
jgi:solute carrier family 6 amino acid transporter-like protein 5/7/9/14